MELPFFQGAKITHPMVRGSAAAGDKLPEDLGVAEAAPFVLNLFRKRCEIIIKRVR